MCTSPLALNSYHYEGGCHDLGEHSVCSAESLDTAEWTGTLGLLPNLVVVLVSHQIGGPTNY
jgi:hypothetical protein